MARRKLIFLKDKMINVTFPDGSVKQFEQGVTPYQIAESISPRFAQDVLAATVNDEEWDISRPVCSDCAIKLFKWDDAEGKHAFWHTSAHLLAEALQELYKGIQFGIGPAIENGFYYDIDPGENSITSADFPKIEMAELAAKKEAVVRKEISKADALKAFGDRGETYKCELISELEDGTISGSTTNLFDEFRNLLSFSIPFADALAACTINPARVIGADSVCGSLEEGKNADIVFVDSSMNLKHVMIKGKLIY